MNHVKTVAAVFCFSLSTPTWAEDFIKFGEETFELAGGAFLQYFDTNVKVEEQGLGLGAEIGLEDDLGYDDNETSGQLGASWRFADRHRLSLGYFSADRDVLAVATEDIDLGDGEMIPAGAGYESEFNIDVMPFKYSYSFAKSDASEFYGTLGLHWYSIDYNVLGAVGIGDDEFEGSVVAEADAPMPLVGLGYDYYITDRWKLALLGEAFYINLSDDTFSFEGSLVNLKLSTEYYLWNNFAVGAALSYFKLNVDLDDSDWKGSLDYEYWGPAAYIKLRF